MKMITKMFKNEDGATAIEYGLIAALIAVAAIAGMTTLGGRIGGGFNNVAVNLRYKAAYKNLWLSSSVFQEHQDGNFGFRPFL